jgi:hypothetical protein
MRPALTVASIVLVVAIGIVVFQVATTGRVLADSCRLASVDEEEYVAGNRAILDELPIFPGAVRRHTLSVPIPATDDCLRVLSENGPPYDKYMTDDRYSLPARGRNIVASPWGESDVPSVLIWYDRNLRNDGWRLSHWSGCCQVYFKREPGVLIGVRAVLNTDDPYKREPYYVVRISRD